MISNPSNVLLPHNTPCPVPAPSIDEIGKHFCISWLVARLEMTLLATEQYLGNQESQEIRMHNVTKCVQGNEQKISFKYIVQTSFEFEYAPH